MGGQALAAEGMGILGRGEGVAPKKARDIYGWGHEASFRGLGAKIGPASSRCATLGQPLHLWEPQCPHL